MRLLSTGLLWPACAVLTVVADLPAQDVDASDGGATVLLGGACIETPESGAYLELRRAQTAARRDAGPEAVIELQKEIVRLRCDNSWRWARLAELYLDAGRNEEAVAVLTHLDSVAPNELEEIRNRRPEKLHAAWESDAFAGSVLDRRMVERRAAHRDRRASFEALLDTLSRRPPAEWVSEGACPFECCVYRSWSVLEETPIYSRARGDSVLAILQAGSEVEALTGDVYVKPLPVLVLHPEAVIPLEASELEPGDVVFLLDYLGEGFSRLWYDGEIVQTATEPGVRAYCPIPATNCWGEYFDPEARTDRTVWWVQVRTRDGLVGWSDRPRHFGNKDACG